MPSTTLFLCGDLMLGRGVDQLLPRSVDPRLHERFVDDARRYVELAESAHGPLPEEIDHTYVWGDALEELDDRGAEPRIANLETAVTARGDPWPGKGIHYRMHPGNLATLTAAELDACVVANNHALDWGREGFLDTLRALEDVGIEAVGGGRDGTAALRPAVLDAGERTVRVFGFGCPSAGVPRRWAADDARPGIGFLPATEGPEADRAIEQVRDHGGSDDVTVVSLHWGGNWGHRVPDDQRTFARRLIDEAGVDVVHGHSSHHPKAVELHRGRPILYGCGDLLNDYEGISGHEDFRPELTLLYFVGVGESPPHELTMTPIRIHRFRLERVGGEAGRWLAETLDRESRRTGTTRVEHLADGRLRARSAS